MQVRTDLTTVRALQQDLLMMQVRRVEDERPTFKVLAEKAGVTWFISVPDVPGALASVRRHDYIESIARAAISRVLGLSEESFDVEIDEVEA
jgi:hypothetical protein